MYLRNAFAERAPLVQQEVLVHHEERAHLELLLGLAHDVEQLLSGFVKVDEPPLAAEERRGRAEITAHGTANRRDNGRGGIAAALGRLETHQPEAE